MTKMILGCGNPLLDISAEVPQSVLDKYGMTLNNAILAEAAHMPLYEELVANHDVTYIAGGATQNSIRVAQWFLNTTGSTSYIGSVGNDAYGKQLESSATADGVQVHYHVDKETETGTCAVLIMHKERSMVANLGAANKYDFSHLKENMHVLESAQIVYISGFFLTVSPETIMHVAEHCKATGKTLVMNLAAPFISMFFSEPLLAALEFVDIIVGNESEALAFAEKMGYEDVSPAAVAQKLAEFPSQRSTPRVAIVTQGPGETIVFTSGEQTTYPVPAVPEDKIVDVNGAGDAFVGGLLARLSQDRSLADGVAAGHYCASVILGRSGTSLVGLKPDFE